MKAILIGGLGLLVAWLGGNGPAGAVPLPVIVPLAEPATPLALLVRHHRHHHRHWRHWYSRGWEYGPPEADPSGIEGQTGPAPAYPAPETSAHAPPTTDRASRAGSGARPSIRWVNPENTRR